MVKSAHSQLGIVAVYTLLSPFQTSIGVEVAWGLLPESALTPSPALSPQNGYTSLPV